MDKKEHFWELCSNLTLKIDNRRYPNSLFYFKNENYIFQYEIESGILWCSYKNIWSILKKEYDLTGINVQAFIKSEVEEHFKCKEVTPNASLKALDTRMEEHFKCKKVTPRALGVWRDSDIEEHFKNLK